MPLSTSRLAQAAGVGIQTLRYYERRGLLPAPPRTRAGYRQFGTEAVRRVRFIRRAQEMGFTLAEVGELLALRLGGERNCGRVERSARAAQARVREQLARLQRVDRVLSRLVRACSERHTPRGECPILDALEEE